MRQVTAAAVHEIHQLRVPLGNQLILYHIEFIVKSLDKKLGDKAQSVGLNIVAQILHLRQLTGDGRTKLPQYSSSSIKCCH